MTLTQHSAALRACGRIVIRLVGTGLMSARFRSSTWCATIIQTSAVLCMASLKGGIQMDIFFIIIQLIFAIIDLIFFFV